jgi:uncharacterized metal-binding protein
MPSARTHDIITVVSGASGTAAAWNMGLPEFEAVNTAVLLGSYLVSGFLFSPDLDLRSRPYMRWRWLRWVWIPYQRSVRHRSWVSHSLLAGPVIRILYFTGIISLLALIALALLNLLVPVDPTGTLLSIASSVSRWINIHPFTVGYAVAGFFLGSASHVVADAIVSFFKRVF